MPRFLRPISDWIIHCILFHNVLKDKKELVIEYLPLTYKHLSHAQYHVTCHNVSQIPLRKVLLSPQ